MPNNYKQFILFSFFAVLLAIAGCKKPTIVPSTEMTVEEERDLGREIRNAIENAPDEFPVLDESYYQKSYSYLYTVYQTMINAAVVENYNDFYWEIYIIADDNVKDAFMLPGGYLYIYTGLLKYLNTENQLASVLSYEIMNADLHFSKIQLEQDKSLSLLLDVAKGGNPDLALNLALTMKELQYSAEQVKEADTSSIESLCNSSYRASGIQYILERAKTEEILPRWVQENPSIVERFDWIQGKLQEIKCEGDLLGSIAYMDFLQQLP